MLCIIQHPPEVLIVFLLSQFINFVYNLVFLGLLISEVNGAAVVIDAIAVDGAEAEVVIEEGDTVAAKSEENDPKADHVTGV